VASVIVPVVIGRLGGVFVLVFNQFLDMSSSCVVVSCLFDVGEVVRSSSSCRCSSCCFCSSSSSSSSSSSNSSSSSSSSSSCCRC
jgi:hypothetical protein